MILYACSNQTPPPPTLTHNYRTLLMQQPLLPAALTTHSILFTQTNAHTHSPLHIWAGILEETTNQGNRTLEKALFSHADAVTQRFFGDAVYYRGICEFSNVCANDCGYCGIRKHQKGVRRYTMPVHEVLEVSHAMQ